MQKNSQLKVLNTLNILEGIASSFVGIFVPIYLLTIGFSLRTIFIYLLIYSVGIIPFFTLSAKLCQLFGIKKTFLARIPVRLIFLASIFLVKEMPILVFFIPLIKSLDASLFYYPLHLIFATNALKEEMGKRVASFFAWPKAVKIILPAISAGIAIMFGFTSLFGLAVIIYMASAFVYFKFEEIKIETSFNYRKVIEFIKKYPRYISIEVIENWREDAGIVWSLFVFTSVSAINGTVGQKLGIMTVGILDTIAAVIALLFNVYAGHLADRYDKKKILNVGFIVSVVLWSIAYFAESSLINLYILGVFFSIASAYIEVPYQAMTYNLAKENKAEEFIVFREVPLLLGRGLLYLLAIVFATKLKVIFLISSFVYLVFLFI